MFSNFIIHIRLLFIFLFMNGVVSVSIGFEVPSKHIKLHKTYFHLGVFFFYIVFRGNFNLEKINLEIFSSLKFPRNFPFIKVNCTFINGLWMKIIVFVSSLPVPLIFCRPRLNTKQDTNVPKKSLWKIIDLELWRSFVIFVNENFFYDVCEWRFLQLCGRGGKYLVSLAPVPITR
jgi:hypothetical protein